MKQHIYHLILEIMNEDKDFVKLLKTNKFGICYDETKKEELYDELNKK